MAGVNPDRAVITVKRAKLPLLSGTREVHNIRLQGVKQALLPRIIVQLLLMQSAVAQVDNHVRKIATNPAKRSEQRIPLSAKGSLLLRKPGTCLSGENIAPVLTGRAEDKEVDLSHLRHNREHIKMELRQTGDPEKGDTLGNLLHSR